MKRKVYKIKAGKISRLIISNEDIYPPTEEKVLVEVKSIGLNFADVFAILGLYSATPDGPFIPGLEYSGIVLEVGSEVSEFKPGDRVMGVTRFGGYTSLIATDPRYLVALPNHWSFNEGASYLVQMLTAYYGLVNLADIKKEQCILIHSAAGGVGIWANRIAKAYNCFTIGTVGKGKKLELLREEGFDESLVRNTNTFKRDLKNLLAGRRLNIIMECIGGSIMSDGFDLLSPMGRLVLYGSAHYGGTGNRPFWPKLIWKYLRRPKIDPQNMIRQNKSVMAFNLIYLFDNIDLMHDILQQVRPLQLGKPIIGHIYPYESLPEAIRLFQSGVTIGKVVITV